MSTAVTATFLVAAPDQPGLVARFAGFFSGLGLNIVDAKSHTDVHATPKARFFMRILVDLGGLATPSAHARLGGSATRGALEAAFGDIVRELAAEWTVPKLAILVTKEPTCLYDLILRERSGELPGQIALIVSNHPTLEPVAASFRIPFFALPVSAETKRAQEEEVISLLKKHHVDLVVLARYMQVVTDEFLKAAPPVINIHHGFLPAFQGGKPYHQAHARGVKLVGATAHYATKDLDQGPIIEQDVVRVTHAMGPAEMARLGRDVERVVLARAVLAHLERRVIVEGARTIVF
jgi:formyltetrahydrofolate deformylase